MFSDYHVHSSFSADSQEEMSEYIKIASEKGVNEICFTDHFDWDYPSGRDWTYEIEPAFDQISALNESQSDVKIKYGVEMGLRLDEGVIPITLDRLKKFQFDHVIASVHLVDGQDPYFPEYFQARTKAQGFSLYIETLLQCLRQTDFYTVAGHFDYPAKGCPHDDNVLKYDDAPDQIDALFSHLIERGKCIEFNTSILKKLHGQLPDIDIYKRYVELGGEFITLGSDAHSKQDLAYKFQLASDFAKSAGIRYLVGFDKMTPVLRKI